YELLRELRRRGRLATLPVAVLSSRAGEAHRAKAMALGACDYLVKPFDEGALAETVHRHKG
ncbi:MAG: response regulator, partial [Desulfuromonadales bacterium]|nr:response regulator [Desulfuromonadales bacterium]